MKDKYINWFMYLLFFLFILIIWRTEKLDNTCPTFTSSKEQCKKQGGMAYSGTQPQMSDSYSTLLNKISKAATYDSKTIKWRRSMITAFIVTLTISLLVLGNGHLVEWYKFYIATFLAFMIIYGTENYYSYHVSKRPEANVVDAVKMLKRKIYSKNDSY